MKHKLVIDHHDKITEFYGTLWITLFSFSMHIWAIVIVKTKIEVHMVPITYKKHQDLPKEVRYISSTTLTDHVNHSAIKTVMCTKSMRDMRKYPGEPGSARSSTCWRLGMYYTLALYSNVAQRIRKCIQESLGTLNASRTART